MTVNPFGLIFPPRTDNVGAPSFLTLSGGASDPIYAGVLRSSRWRKLGACGSPLRSLGAAATPEVPAARMAMLIGEHGWPYLSFLPVK